MYISKFTCVVQEIHSTDQKPSRPRPQQPHAPGWALLPSPLGAHFRIISDPVVLET